MTLEQILTEEDKASILNEVERERRRILIERLYKIGLEHPQKAIRYGTIKALSGLAKVDPSKFVQLFEKVIDSKDYTNLYSGFEILETLANIDANKFVDICKMVKWDSWKCPKEKVYSTNDINLWESLRCLIVKSFKVLPSINVDIYLELYKWGITHGHPFIGSYPFVAEETANTLDALVSVDKERFLKLFEEGAYEPTPFVSSKFKQKFDSLAVVDSDTFIDLYKQRIANKYDGGRESAFISLHMLASVRPSKFIELFDESIGEFQNIGGSDGADKLFGALARINPEKFLQIYEKQVNCSENKYQNLKYLAKSIDCLADKRPKSFIRLCERGMNSENPSVKIGTAQTLYKLATLNLTKFLELYNLGMKDESIQGETAESIIDLANINPILFVELCQKGINHKSKLVRYGTAKVLGKLASLNPTTWFILYKKGLQEKDEEENYNVTLAAAESLGSFVQTLTEKEQNSLIDDEYNFLITYLHSKYTKNPDRNHRPKQEIQQELIKLVRNSEGIDYQKLQRILEAGEAKDLDEMVECSKVNVKNYRVIRKVGEGAFKKVYLGESEKSLGYFVVLKQVNPSQFGIDSISQHYTSFKDWLSEELHITRLAKLKSPYVARLEAPIEGEDGNIYLVEEPFKETLREKLEREGMLSIEETLKIALQIAQGLKDAHNYAEGQIIHRDLKPSNIGLDENCNVKLTDFGSLESMSRSPRDGDLSNILHSAPEVLEGGKTTVKSNIYSVGVLLYEMLTGESLFAPRDETGKLKLKPKEVGEEREEYKREVLSNIKKASNTDGPHGILELITKFRLIVTDYTQRPIKHNISEVEFETYRLLDNLIEECTEYQSKDRDYDSIEEMIKEIIIIISEFEGIYNFNRFCIEEQRSGEDYEQRSIKLKEDLLPMIMKAEASTCLRKYKCVISDDDYKTIETALKWLRPTKT